MTNLRISGAQYSWPILAETKKNNRGGKDKGLDFYGLYRHQSNIEKDRPATDQVRVNAILKEHGQNEDQSLEKSA